MAPETQTGERYATQVGELWSGLAQTLASLEALAGAPGLLEDDDALDALRRLQYRLHAAGQYTLSLSPPASAEPAHAELAAALTGARDATGEIVEAVDIAGFDAVEPILHEWRGALFRVRLARLRMAGGAHPTSREEARLPSFRAPLTAFLLTIGGAVAFAIGATIGPWPLWVAGVLGLCTSVLAYRP